MHLRQQSMMEATNPNSRERELRNVSVCYCTVKLIKVGQTVNSGKCSNLVKDWSNERGLSANINLFGFLSKFGL